MLMSNVLSANNRTSGRKSQLTEIRQQGGIPGVVYGYKVDNTPITISRAEFLKTMREVGRNGVISLDLDGESLNVLLHEYQEDPIKREVIHVDFLSVDMDQEIEANVRVEITGEPSGEGVLQQLLHELVITAKPDQIPEVFEFEVSDLEIGDTITIGEIRKNYTVEINHEDDEAIVTVTPPMDEVEEVDEDTDAVGILGEDEDEEDSSEEEE